jgi:dipeptidase
MRAHSLALFCHVLAADACSNILVTPGASVDGSALVGDNDDSSRRHGLVGHWPAADHAAGATREIWDFDSGTLLGRIPQPPHTFNVVSRGNEKGVVMAETTHGGLSNLTGGSGNIMDYGSLMVTTLQRASSAREAIRTVAQLTNDYGYASSAEGFSISDGDESWSQTLIEPHHPWSLLICAHHPWSHGLAGTWS